jgi:hypothetical protein
VGLFNNIKMWIDINGACLGPSEMSVSAGTTTLNHKESVGCSSAFEGYGIIPFIDEEDEYFLSLFKF